MLDAPLRVSLTLFYKCVIEYYFSKMLEFGDLRRPMGGSDIGGRYWEYGGIPTQGRARPGTS